jgi:hypothetical protein
MYSPSIPIPDDWTVDQAVAVSEFIQQIADAIWDKYAIALVTYYRENNVSCFHNHHSHDEIPF